MEPIINPWLVYFASITDSIVAASFIFTSIVTVAFLFLLGFYIGVKIEEGEGRETKILRAWSIRSGIAALVFLLITVFTPSRNTIIAMTVANAITPNAIEAAADVGKDVVDYLTESIEDLIDGVNEDETVEEEETKE
jgi:hypothetical protein